MLKTPAQRAAAFGAGVAGLCGLLHLLGVGLPILLSLAILIAVLSLVVPWVGANWAGDIVRWARGWFWAPEQGRFDSFGGVPLRIDDDGRHVWVDGDGLQRALGRREPDAALAARHSGRWRRTDEGDLMLRVDAVIQVLATMPGRDAPRLQRLRRYLERDVLYPAAQRRARRQMPSG